MVAQNFYFCTLGISLALRATDVLHPILKTFLGGGVCCVSMETENKTVMLSALARCARLLAMQSKRDMMIILSPLRVIDTL
jgi:hypothetical protein